MRSAYVRIYASRGGIAEADLRALVDRGLSIRQISGECGLSPTTVRHWLRRFGLRTRRARRVVRGEPLRECPRHGLTTFRRFGGSGSLRCPRCASARVTRRRRRAKEILVAEAGCACVLCGYDRYVGALNFTTSTRRRSGSRSQNAASRAPSRFSGRRRKNACYCAPTATRKSRRDSFAPILSAAPRWAVRGSSIRQSDRLLTGRLLVRVQPRE